MATTRNILLTALTLLLCLAWLTSPGLPALAGEPEPEIKQVLESYFKKMASLYPPGGKSGKGAPSLTAARGAAGKYWALSSKANPEVPAMKSAMFFAIYQPVSWKLIKLRQAGDFARAKVSMDVGSPLKLKLAKGPIKKKLRYDLIRTDGRWLITRYKELGKKPKPKAAPPSASAPPPPAHMGPKEVLERYLSILANAAPGGPGGNPAAGMKDLAAKTKNFWPQDQARKRPSAQSISTFSTYQPTSWEVTPDGISQGQAAFKVALIPGNPNWIGLKGGKPGKVKVRYQLTRRDARWLLSGFAYQRSR